MDGGGGGGGGCGHSGGGADHGGGGYNSGGCGVGVGGCARGSSGGCGGGYYCFWSCQAGPDQSHYLLVRKGRLHFCLLFGCIRFRNTAGGEIH